MDSFAAIAREVSPRLDLLALSIAAALRDVDEAAALAELDRLAEAVARHGLGTSPWEALDALEAVLGADEGFAGDVDDYDNPVNSMLDLVLERRRGLPILLSVVWVEVGRRLGLPIHGVGLPGHYVAGWFGDGGPILVDPFRGGVRIADGPPAVESTDPHRTALRMLSNLVAAYERRGELGPMLTCSRLRLDLPLDERDRLVMEFEHRRLSARVN